MFIKNVKPISLFSAFTWLVFMFLFSFLYSNVTSMLGLKTFSTWNLFAFAAAMSSCDANFVFPYLRETMGESHIVAVLEGETVLSEVFSILAFRTIIEMQINTVDGLLLIEGFWSFLRFLVVSVFIGVVMGVLASLLIKYIHNRESDVNYPVVALFFIIPIISYMIAEGLHVSASITIRICGFILSYYTQYSLSTITYP